MRPVRSSLSKIVLVCLLAACALVRLAHGYGWCSEYWNWDGRRKSTRDGHRWPAGDGVVITYINGIFHSVPEWEMITGKLQALFGHEVRPFYNPSSGWWITDASKAGYHLLRKPANDTIAHALGEHLAQAVEDVGRGRVLHIAHSGGALITYLAAQHHLTRRQRDKIDVLTFGGAHSITRKYFNGRVVNYYARNDPLVKLDRRAAELMKLTNNTYVQAVIDKHNTTFVFLEGRAKQFVLDHSLEGPTYQHALRKEARAFRRAHFGPLSPLSWDYDTSLLRLVRKKVAKTSGLHRFFSMENLGIYAMRKSIARITGLSGFFSGKTRDSGADAKALVVSRAQPEEEKSWYAHRLTWPWWKSTDEVKTAREDELVEGRRVDSAGSGEQNEQKWFVGWRWQRGKGRDESQEEDEVSGNDVAIITAGENAEASSIQQPPVSGRLWNIFGFGRRNESRQAAKGATAFSSSDDDALSESEDMDALKEQAYLLAEGSEEASSKVDSKPWLPLGWTPWGAARRPRDDTTTKSNSLPSVSSSVGESEVDTGADGAQTGERDRSVGDIAKVWEEVAVLDKNGQNAQVEQEQSGLKRWWPAVGAKKETLPDEGSDAQEEDNTIEMIDPSNVSANGERVDGDDKPGDTESRDQDEPPSDTVMDGNSEHETTWTVLKNRLWPMSKKEEIPFTSTTVESSEESEPDEEHKDVGQAVVLPQAQDSGAERQDVQNVQETQQTTTTRAPAQSPASWNLWPMVKGVGWGSVPEEKDDSVPVSEGGIEQLIESEPSVEVDRQDVVEESEDLEEELLSTVVIFGHRVKEALAGSGAGNGNGGGDGDDDAPEDAEDLVSDVPTEGPSIPQIAFSSFDHANYTLGTDCEEDKGAVDKSSGGEVDYDEAETEVEDELIDTGIEGCLDGIPRRNTDESLDDDNDDEGNETSREAGSSRSLRDSAARIRLAEREDLR